MHLQIVTPEFVAFEGEVEAVAVPGKNGEFQMLNDHVAIVSTLSKGTVKIKINNIQDYQHLFDEFGESKDHSSIYGLSPKEPFLLFDINGGVVEMNNNKVMVLVS